MKRFSILIAIFCVSTFALAQKADVAVVVGGSFVSNTKETFLPPSTTTFDTVKTDHHLFLEGELGVRLLNAHVASLSLEVPVAGITSQKITRNSTPGTVIDNLSTVFITPGFRLKLWKSGWPVTKSRTSARKPSSGIPVLMSTPPPNCSAALFVEGPTRL